MDFSAQPITDELNDLSDAYMKRQNKVTSISSITEQSDEKVRYSSVIISEPKVVGSAFSAHITYKMQVGTVDNRNFTVQRRFSEFYSLFEYLVDKYSTKGYLIPHTLEKSAAIMTNVKISTSFVSNENYDVLIRIGILEKFMKFCINSPVISVDQEFINFIEDINYKKLSSSSIPVIFSFSSTPLFSGYEDDTWFTEIYNILTNMEKHFKSLANYTMDENKVRSDQAKKMDELSKALHSFCDLNYQPQFTKVMQLFADNQTECSRFEREHMKDELKNVIIMNKHLAGMATGMKSSLNLISKEMAALTKIKYEIDNTESALTSTRVKNDGNLYAKTQKERDTLKGKEMQLQQSLEESCKTIKEQYKMFEEMRIIEFKNGYMDFFTNYRSICRQVVTVFESLTKELQAVQTEIEEV